MLQHRHGLTGLGVPHDNGAVRGAADQVAAARAEAAAVDPVAVTAQGRVGELREVDRAIHTDGLVAGGGGQQVRGEGAAGHLVRMMPKGRGQRRHLATGRRMWRLARTGTDRHRHKTGGRVTVLLCLSVLLFCCVCLFWWPSE